MQAILFVQTDSADELGREFDAWLERYGSPPTVIVGHENLPFACDRDPHDDTLSTFRGVRVLGFGGFIDVEGPSLIGSWGQDGDDEDDE